jgi:hypothetical protein
MPVRHDLVGNRTALRASLRMPVVALTLTLASWLAACGGMPKPTFPIADADSALSRYEATNARVLAVRAEARVDQRGKPGRVRGTVLMFVERGQRVRFDVMTQFGPIAILTSDRERFAFADLREQRYLTGPTCPQNIARLLGVPLSVDETSRFLLGGTPLISAGRPRLAWHDDGFYRVTLEGEDGARQVLDLAVYPEDAKARVTDQRLYLLRSSVMRPDGTLSWRVTCEDHAVYHMGSQVVRLPTVVRVEQPKTQSDTLVRFKEIALNPEIPEQAFQQEKRSGMVEEEASCE